MLRLCSYCQPSRAIPRFVRSAHAATASAAEESAPSSSSSSSTSSYAPHNEKGKAKESDYCFPQRGRLGGPPDPYEVLGLDRSASHEEVKRQYYRLALLLHPDSSHPSSCPENFSKLHRAYTLLSKPSSRMQYLQTGHGWGDSSSSESSNSADEFMRAEARYRARGGAAAWDPRPEYGARYRRSGHDRHRTHGESDAGRGAWGGFTGGGGKWEPYDMGEFAVHPGKREERYMSNLQFFGLVGAISLALTYAQYQRFISAKDSHHQVLQQQHIDASHALAEARREASLHGKERRERIRRRVRESEVIKELEKMELDGGGSSA